MTTPESGKTIAQDMRLELMLVRSTIVLFKEFVIKSRSTQTNTVSEMMIKECDYAIEKIDSVLFEKKAGSL